MYDPAEQGPEAGAPMPDSVDGFDSVKQRPYVGMPITSFSLGAPRDTQYSADQFCGNSSGQKDIEEQIEPHNHIYMSQHNNIRSKNHYRSYYSYPGQIGRGSRTFSLKTYD